MGNISKPKHQIQSFQISLSLPNSLFKTKMLVLIEGVWFRQVSLYFKTLLNSYHNCYSSIRIKYFCSILITTCLAC